MKTDATHSSTSQNTRHFERPQHDQAPVQGTPPPSATLSGGRARPSGAKRLFRELNEVLRDDGSSYNIRLLRIQGWRGAELDQAAAAGSAVRLAPGFCAAGAAAVVLSSSSILALALLVTAVLGTGARNHPVESIYNGLAHALGREQLPRNRAAKRFGCLIGGVFLATSALSLAFGSPLVGRASAGTLAAVAGFVSITNFCIPSAIFITLFGSERSTSCSLFLAASPSCSLPSAPK